SAGDLDLELFCGANPFELGSQPAIGQLHGQCGMILDQWNQPLNQQRGVQPSNSGNSRQPVGKLLAPYLHVQFAALTQWAEYLDNLSLHKAAAFLDDEKLL